MSNPCKSVLIRVKIKPYKQARTANPTNPIHLFNLKFKTSLSLQKYQQQQIVIRISQKVQKMKKLTFLLPIILLFACNKNASTNPFTEVPDPNGETENPIELEPTSLAGLHQNIFKPTCANSGCHDGTFEPDFRTIEGTYNTLVNHPIIKNDPGNTFTFRVVPGNVEASQLVARVTYDIDGNSGIMPLAIDPDSDYAAKKEEYIQNIKDWISAGAMR